MDTPHLDRWGVLQLRSKIRLANKQASFLLFPLSNQITDLRGKLCVVFIGATFAGLD